MRVSSTCRPAYTLIELLLTMAVLIVLAAMTWPTLTSLQGGGTLQRGIDEFRGLLVGIRLKAIEQGTQITVHLQPDTGSYRIAAAGVAGTAQADNLNPPEDDEYLLLDSPDFLGTHQLREGLTFLSEPPESTAGTNSFYTPQESMSEMASQEVRILFRADGTSEDVEFAIVDVDNVAQVFKIRGLTGIISIGDPVTMASPNSKESDSSAGSRGGSGS